MPRGIRLSLNLEFSYFKGFTMAFLLNKFFKYFLEEYQYGDTLNFY